MEQVTVRTQTSKYLKRVQPVWKCTEWRKVKQMKRVWWSASTSLKGCLEHLYCLRTYRWDYCARLDRWLQSFSSKCNQCENAQWSLHTDWWDYCARWSHWLQSLSNKCTVEKKSNYTHERIVEKSQTIHRLMRLLCQMKRAGCKELRLTDGSLHALWTDLEKAKQITGTHFWSRKYFCKLILTVLCSKHQHDFFAHNFDRLTSI